MSNLVINRLPLDIDESEIEIFFSKEELHFRNKPSWLLESFKNKANYEDIISRITPHKKANFGDEDWYHYQFIKPSQDIDFYKLNSKYQNLPKSIKRDFISFHLQSFFNSEKFIVEPYTTANDFQVYEPLNKERDGWKRYRKFDFSIHVYYHSPSDTFRNEIMISIGSEDTWFGKISSNAINDEDHLRVFDPDTRFLLAKKNVSSFKDEHLVKANIGIRKRLDIKPKPVRIFYKNHYQTLVSLKNLLSNKLSGPILVRSEYRTVHPSDIQTVDFENNKMVFESGNEQISPINGMRENGPYLVPDNINEKKLLFIYPDRNAANTLYKYFRRGLGYFPGLTSYTGIPTEPAQERLEYEDDLKGNFDRFLRNDLKKESYENYIAVIITPFAKDTATEKESDNYFYIKQKLLEKNIASQFVGRHRIFSNSFKYHLPNIAIAMLAKCGGVPWKLRQKSYKQLTVGFNIERDKETGESYLGSAIYYDNEGLIKRVVGFNPSNDPESFIQNLKESIEQYLEETDEKHNRLVIHYYKPVSARELERISNLIRNQFKLNIPFAVVEVNDSKTNSEICFDLDYKMLMPQSGTYVRIKPHEFLLFNNERYWDKPKKPIRNEEYPLKIRLYNYDQGGFTYHELISQVYEFSRLHWKGLKQKSNPVTTDYAKEIARFIANFDKNKIPKNKVSQKTVWFI